MYKFNHCRWCSLSLAVGVTLSGVALRLLLLLQVYRILSSNHVIALSATFPSSHLRCDHHILLLHHSLTVIGHGCKAELCLSHKRTLSDRGHELGVGVCVLLLDGSLSSRVWLLVKLLLLLDIVVVKLLLILLDLL